MLQLQLPGLVSFLVGFRLSFAFDYRCTVKESVGLRDRESGYDEFILLNSYSFDTYIAYLFYYDIVALTPYKLEVVWIHFGIFC